MVTVRAATDNTGDITGAVTAGRTPCFQLVSVGRTDDSKYSNLLWFARKCSCGVTIAFGKLDSNFCIGYGPSYGGAAGLGVGIGWDARIFRNAMKGLPLG